MDVITNELDKISLLFLSKISTSVARTTKFKNLVYAIGKSIS